MVDGRREYHATVKVYVPIEDWRKKDESSLPSKQIFCDLSKQILYHLINEGALVTHETMPLVTENDVRRTFAAYEKMPIPEPEPETPREEATEAEAEAHEKYIWHAFSKGVTGANIVTPEVIDAMIQSGKFEGDDTGEAFVFLRRVVEDTLKTIHETIDENTKGVIDRYLDRIEKGASNPVLEDTESEAFETPEEIFAWR